MADAGDATDWTEPTTAYWQALVSADACAHAMQPPYHHGLPVRLPDGQVLVLPIRCLPGAPGRAVASLIANQAAIAVVDALAEGMGALAARMRPDAVVGLPTLGMAFAPGVARALGHRRWVPMGYSRKFWYDEALSTSVASITTPGPGKTIYLDPNQRALIDGQRIVIVDDVVSSAQTLARVWDLLARLGADVVGAVVAMRQGTRWQEALGPTRSAAVVGLFDTPMLERRDDGWWPLGHGTAADDGHQDGGAGPPNG
jgi:adenine/guanine phosphoribosyltransferase-like PRPP-binding protein